MPTSSHSRKYLYSLLGYQPSDDELSKLLDSLGMTLDNASRESIEVEYQANRPDLISTVGLARSIRYFTGKRSSFEYKVEEPLQGFEVSVGRRVAKIRPFFAAMVVKGLELSSDSLLDLINFTEKLTITYGRNRKRVAIGLHDLSKVEPPLTYDAFPDEEYDALRSGRMRYSEVLKNTSKGKAYAQLCNVGDYYCALKDKRGTLSLIPVLNSERTMVTEKTADMLVDITGTNSFVVEKTADIVAANMIDMGAKVYKVSIKKNGRQYTTPSMSTLELSVPLSRFSYELGVRLAFNNVISLANKMGIQAALVGRNIRFTVPAYRADIINDQDIVEDIAVAYGYDYIQPIPVVSIRQGALSERQKTADELRHMLNGLGFFETMSSYLTNEETNYAKMRLKPDSKQIRLANAKAITITMMRTWLLPSLLLSLSKSQHDKLPHRLFELDMCFYLDSGKVKEAYDLAGIISDSSIDFNELSSVVSAIASFLGKKLETKPFDHASFIPGRCASIWLDGKHAGFYGELHPEVLENFGVQAPAMAFELELF